jgi:hypothetical protein
MTTDNVDYTSRAFQCILCVFVPLITLIVVYFFGIVDHVVWVLCFILFLACCAQIYFDILGRLEYWLRFIGSHDTWHNVLVHYRELNHTYDSSVKSYYRIISILLCTRVHHSRLLVVTNMILIPM